jgi:hypothetical protein
VIQVVREPSGEKLPCPSFPAVDHPVAVSVVERRGHLGGDPHRVAHGELLLPVEPSPEALAFDEGHGVEEESLRS